MIEFQIPQVDARESLRMFATQSGESLIFSSEEVDGVTTLAISGNFTPSKALEEMLLHTSLGFVMDVETGAFAIVKTEPEIQELSPEPSSCNSVDSDKHNPNQLNQTKMHNEKSLLSKLFRGLLGIAVATSSATIHAQEVDVGEDVYELSPFVIDTSEDVGSYQANSTLAGARVRTELKDVASAISVITAEFLRDTGATDNQSLLQYTPNTEVGGIYGNYAGVGNTFVSGISEANIINPNSNTRVRGLDSADNTRNFFQTDIPWDSYIVDRVDLQRGPNSILFGIGSPAGIIDASPNTAISSNLFEIENRMGSFGSIRTSLDVNRVIIEDQLMIRLAILDNNTKYRQKPAYNNDQRIYGAMRWEPDFFQNDSMKTTIRANFEKGNIESNNPRVLPPVDKMQGFFATDGFNGTVVDSAYAYTAGIVQYMPNKPPIEGATPNYWYVQGTGTADGPLLTYDNIYSPSSPIDAYQGMITTYFGIDGFGVRDESIQGASINGKLGLGGYASYVKNKHARLGNVAGVEAGDKGFYKDRSISDPSIFDFYNYLIDGPNKIEKQEWTAYNMTLEQSFFSGRLAFEAVYDYQDYYSFRESNLGNPFISIDVNANNIDSTFADTGVISFDGTGTAGDNPNAGRAYVSGSGGGAESRSIRENIRITTTGEIRGDDFFEESWLTRILGRHVFTGLYTDTTQDQFGRNWYRYGVDTAYGEVLGFGGGGNPDLGKNITQNLEGVRVAAWMSYISEPLIGLSSAQGVNMQPITTQQSPAGTYPISYFDSHWKWSMNPNDPSYVDPAAPYTLVNNANPAVPTASTQSENPDNYIGWTTTSARILNASEGDRDQLTYDATKIQKRTESKALTWQGYLWDDTIVTTFGWRRDTQKLRSGAGVNSPVNGVASLDFDLDPLDTATGVATGETRSWGLVAHTPHFLRDKLPLGSNISVFYDEGNNNRVENRYGFNGETLPNAAGKTKDYGIVLNTLNDRLQLKVTWYETIVRNANISSVTTGSSTLGDYEYELASLEGWGTASALMCLAGVNGQAPGMGWYWNYASMDDPAAVPDSDDPYADAFLNHPTTQLELAAIQSWLDQMQPQSWYDAFKIPINVAKAAAGDWANSVEGWDGSTGYVTGINPLGGNRINGVYPTGTVDNKSEGVEFEVVGQITDNWNISINASKQTASQIALGSGMVDFIEAQHEKFQSPAGDLRLWWAEMRVCAITIIVECGLPISFN